MTEDTTIDKPYMCTTNSLCHASIYIYLKLDNVKILHFVFEIINHYILLFIQSFLFTFLIKSIYLLCNKYNFSFSTEN